MNLDRDRLVADLIASRTDPSPERATREVLARALASPDAVARALGEPQRGGVERLHVSDDLTILNVIWAPRMTLKPHEHRMWAVIGVYGGREDNIFWRRRAEAEPGLEAAGAASIAAGDVHPLGRDVVHSVTNPTGRLTGAIHVYGGNFFTVERSEWDPETLLERPYDIAANVKLFEEANAALAARG